jgi:ADP-ribose pyrophosphatase YjhB (NUDIX family)
MIKKLDPKILRDHKGVSFVGVTTCFFCYDGSGEFFMSKRSKNARDEKGTWEIGGGGLKWGLKAEDNLVKELKEEYSAEPIKITFLGYRDIFRKLDDGTKTHWLGLDYAILVDRTDMKLNEPDMIDEIGWFTLDNLPHPTHSQQEVFFNKYKNKIKKILNQPS